MGLVSPFGAPHGCQALETSPPEAPGTMITTPRVVGFSTCDAPACTPVSVLPRASSVSTPPSRQSSLTEALLSQPSLIPRLTIKVRGAKSSSQQPRRHSARPAHTDESSEPQQQLGPRRTASALLLTTAPGRGGEGMHLPRCPTASLEIPRLHRTSTCPSVFAEDIVAAALNANSPHSSTFSSFSSLSTTTHATSCLGDAGGMGLTPRRLGPVLPPTAAVLPSGSGSGGGRASAAASMAAAPAAAAFASTASSPSAASSLHSWCGGGCSSSQPGLLQHSSPQQLLAAAEMQRAEAARRLFEAQAVAATAQAQAQTLREALRKERAQVEQLEAELERMRTERDELLLLQAKGATPSEASVLQQPSPFGRLGSGGSRRGPGSAAQPALRVSFKDGGVRQGAGGGHGSRASAGVCQGEGAMLAGGYSPPTPDAERE